MAVTMNIFKVLGVLAISVILTSCGGGSSSTTYTTPTYSPPHTPSSPTIPSPPPPILENRDEKRRRKNYAVIDVFFATDRKENDNSDIKSRFGVKRGKLKYGITNISIPRDHRMGELESPSIWKLEFQDNPENHVIMLDITTLDRSSYYEAVSKKVNKSLKKNAFIFVHGYNVTFEDAARRTAQISYDLGFDGVPVFYSWPSYGSTPKYAFDENNIEWAQSNIEKFLKDFLEKSDAENIYLIAHSMGNRALTKAYVSLINSNLELKSRFTEIILAAPDIDANVFKRDIAPVMVQAGIPVTLYASSDDIALKASKIFHGGYPRAGDSGQDLIVLSGIESIDSTNVKTGFLGHSYYADERSVISDMFYIFNHGLRASKRAGLNEIPSSNGIYWEFKK
jgi:esterase/lipase superfamily enzyme